VYGGSDVLPTPEAAPTIPRSLRMPSRKLAAEQCCRVFSELYGLETVVLRYFNVFGPRQRPVSAYAAVIPLFRDFTYVSDVVRANLAAIAAPGERCSGEFYNVSGGKRWSLLNCSRRWRNSFVTAWSRGSPRLDPVMSATARPTSLRADATSATSLLLACMLAFARRSNGRRHWLELPRA